MTSMWDFHGGIAFKLSTQWDQEMANRLKASLSAIYEAIKDRKEYQNYMLRWSQEEELNGKTLVEAFRWILDQEWKQSLMGTVATFVSGDLHDFDHFDLPLNGRPTFGHHTSAVLVRGKGNKTNRDIVAKFEQDYRY